MESRNLKAWCRQGWLILRSMREGCSRPLSLAMDGGSPFIRSHHLPPIPFCFCVQVSLLVEGQQSYWVRAQPKQFILTWLPLEKHYLQIRSQSEVLGLGLYISFIGGQNSVPNNQVIKLRFESDFRGSAMDWMFVSSWNSYVEGNEG